MRGEANIWRTCIDFGTAASKASTCSAWDKTGPLYAHVHPLRLGAICQEPNPYVAESALLFDAGRVFFGWNARKRAADQPPDTEVLHSFKTFLASADLSEALSLKLKRTVDRSGRFSQRDALTLYVAYLLRLTERAMALDANLPREASQGLRRYAYPTWRTGAAANTMLAEIFDVASSLSDTLGEQMLSPQGAPADAALEALQRARPSPGRGRIEAGVYEAQAAAECHFAYTRGLPHHVIVFDMGAGTTDITSFEFRETPEGHTMREIANSRRTILLACDEVDKLLMSFILDRAKLASSHANRLWRHLALRRRQLKEELFAQGATSFDWENKRYGVHLNDFRRDQHFQAFCAAIEQNFKYCLTQVELRAAAAGHTEVGVILAGGGASLPFVQKMAMRARPSARGIKKLLVQPLVPTWAKDPSFKHLANIFPQVSISIGGAVAHVHAADLHF
ncbi:MAG: Hsp70 family protein [Hyphomonadaceae bacterium]|nr:Hsp70 family protein [Hyphomonadaceae bacterium]MBY0565255.1 Hsp70 family protein [Hyphomonadaceae bacterium]